MADDIDAMLQGSDQTPASPAQTNDQMVEGDQLDQQTPEEVEWNKLSGSAQERFKKAWQKVREKEVEVEQLRSTVGSIPPPPPGANLQNPEVQNAVRQLDQVGVATKDFVREELNAASAQLRYEEDMRRLASEYRGTRGEPQFVREEYEEYVNSHPQYRNYYPEDVFKDKMFRDEFLNLETTDRQAPRSKGTTLRPTRTSMQKESLTPEGLEEKLKSLQPNERSQWLTDHQEEVNAMMGRMNPNQ